MSNDPGNVPLPGATPGVAPRNLSPVGTTFARVLGIFEQTMGGTPAPDAPQLINGPNSPG